MRIIFFIESLTNGGKERRLLELLKYLKNYKKYKILMVLTKNEIFYEDFFKLGIKYEVIERKFIKKDPRLFFLFYKICKSFKPHIIHTWGNMVTFYSLPVVILKKIPLINSEIGSRIPLMSKFNKIISKINFRYSYYIIPNNYESIKNFNLYKYKNVKVIYNGIDFNRFESLKPVNYIKNKYKIFTPYAVIMVANFNNRKNYDLFFSCAINILKIRDDIGFICVGDGEYWYKYKEKYGKYKQIIFTGKVNDVENVINASDIGILFSHYGEGMSNTILEYMALSKPVIASNFESNREIILDGVNGYLVNNDQDINSISKLITNLIDNPNERIRLGKNGRMIVESRHSLIAMGKEYDKIYREVL